MFSITQEHLFGAEVNEKFAIKLGLIHKPCIAAVAVFGRYYGISWTIRHIKEPRQNTIFQKWNDKWHLPEYCNGSYGHEWDFGKFSFFIRHRKAK